VGEVVARAGERLDLGDVELAIQLGGVELFADPLLERAFYNLIGNAVQHGERLSRVRFTGLESPAGLVVTCEDDGVGIPAGEKERIFHPGFSRSGGYGLFLVREILGITGISIHEDGDPGKGARFIISAPAGTWQKRPRPQA
jgi:signal transduction histidine kinase